MWRLIEEAMAVAGTRVAVSVREGKLLPYNFSHEVAFIG